MKILIAVLSIIMMNTQELMAETLNIEVNNIEKERGGHIIVFIFSKDGFPKNHKKAIYTITKEPISKNMNFKFTIDQPLIEFSIKVLHDENKNGKVSKNWTGIVPIEGLGFSNKQRLSIKGPPSYKKSKIVDVDYAKIIKINILYP